MISPGMRHNAQIAARQALSAGIALSASPDSLHIQLRELAQDVERLRALPTTADRVKTKRNTLLPKWLPTVEKYLESGEQHTNLVFSYCVIWLIDTGEFEQGLNWADIAIEQNQPTPENIRRSMAAFVADEVLAWAEREAEYGHSVEPYFSRTFANIREKWRLHEEINAKWFKFAALLLLRDKDGKPLASAVEDIKTLQDAESLLAQAHAFHPAVGVKTLREKIAQRIRYLVKKLPHGGAGLDEADTSHDANQAVDSTVPLLSKSEGDE